MSLPARRLWSLAAVTALAACGGRIIGDGVPVGTSAPAPTTVAPATSAPRPVVVPPEAGKKTPAPPKPSLPDSAELVDLGSRQSGETLTFTVPPSTLGFQIVAQGKNEESDIVRIDLLESPSGEIVFQDGKPRGTDVPTAEGYGWASGAVPQADVYRKSPVEPGAWKVKLFTDAGTSLRVALAIQRTSDGLFHGGELDLHVYVPVGLMLSLPGPKHEVTIQDAPVDDSLGARIDAFYSMLEDISGIGRGNVYFHGIPERFSSLDIESDALLAAFRETRVAADGQAVHVVFTNDLGGLALGVAPAVPGNAMETGTSLSAIAVTQYEDSSPELDAYTMVHELGHFVGLSHTTEFTQPGLDGGYYDPLPDTPACDGGVTEQNIFNCPDFNNVMFPTGEQETGTFSIAQIRVVRGSPIYRARQTGPLIAPPRKPLPRITLPSGKLPPHVRRCSLITRRPKP